MFLGVLCPKCGKLNEDGKAFCSYCGARLETPATMPLRDWIVKKQEYKDLKDREKRRRLPEKEPDESLAPYKGLVIIFLGIVCLVLTRVFTGIPIQPGITMAFNMLLSVGFGCVAGGSMLMASNWWPSLKHRAAGVTLTFFSGPLVYYIYLVGPSEPDIQVYLLPFLGLTIIGVVLIFTGSERLEKLAEEIFGGLAK